VEKDKQKIKIEGVMQFADLSVVLEQLIADMKKGTLAVQVGDEALVLHPCPRVNVVVKAATNKEAETFQLEISWKRPPELGGVAGVSR